ncbi:MAG: phytanoyl-CoA dioxygenase family protein [Opitutales bacterium]
MSTETHFDAVAELHAPELYQPAGTGQGVERLEDIGPAEIATYHEQGYLVVRQAFTPAETQDALDGLVDLILGKQPDFTHIWFEGKARDLLPTLNAEQRQDAVRKIGDFIEFDARLKALSHHARMLAAVSRLMHGRKPVLFQDMALIKPPRLGREKPWHQDHAYFEYPLGTPVVGVWIALDEATVANGCMQILPGRHKEGPIVHFQRRDWQICDNVILGTKSVAVPLAPGGALFFDGLLPHGTPHNSSPQRRRALQFHYAPDGVAKGPKEDRLKHFGSEGKDVTC